MFNRNENQGDVAIQNFDAEYEAPSLSLLGEDKGKPGVGDIKANANIIKRTFQNFGNCAMTKNHPSALWNI